MANDKGEVKIRRMVDADIPKVNYIDSLLFGERREHIWPFSFEAYWSLYRPQLSFVAELEGEVVGFVAGNTVPEEHIRSIISLRRTGKPSSRDRQVAWIDFIDIHPEYQRRRVGRALIEAFHEECKRTNADMRTSARESDESIKNFLASLGFRKSSFVTYVKD